MPAGIEVDDSMFSARELPWHGLGVVVEDCLTAADAIRTADLDWEVVKVPIYRYPTSALTGTNSGLVEIQNRFATVRADLNKVLGIVGSDYVLFQNVDHFTFLDNLVDSGEAKYETAGSLYGGKRLFLTAKIPEGINIGGVDPHDLYLFLQSSHDGSKAIEAGVSPVRIVCANTAQLASRTAKTKWTVRHVTTAHERLQEARTSLQLTFKYAEEFQVLAESLLSQEFVDREFKALTEQLIPDRPRAENERMTLRMLFNTSPTLENIRNTKWAALNAVTEYSDHLKEYRTAESRLTSTLSGFGKKTRDKALRLLTA